MDPTQIVPPARIEHSVTKELAWTNIRELSIQKRKGNNKRIASDKQLNLTYRRFLFVIQQKPLISTWAFNQDYTWSFYCGGV